MSGLMSAAEELRMEELADLPDARLEEDFVELHRASEAVEAEKLRRLAELDRRRTFERDGHLSAAAWLAAAFSMAWGAARELVRVARALEDMPETRRALDAGEVSTSAVRVLVTARDADPAAFRRCERELVEAARIHRIHELQRVAGYWRQAVEQEHRAKDVDTLFQRRRLHASPTIFGMVRVDGELDPETGETLLTALRAILDAESRSPDPSDHRTPAQRRADALGEVCRQYLDLGDRPSVGGEKPHVTLTVDIKALGDGDGVVTEFDHIGPVRPEVARRVACDAAALPPWRTWCSCAGGTTGSSISRAVSGWSSSTGGRCFGGPTDRCWKTGHRHDKGSRSPLTARCPQPTAHGDHMILPMVRWLQWLGSR